MIETMTDTPPAVKERGIIMQAESVRAILDGRKSQTRRVMKPQPDSTGLKHTRSRINGDHIWVPYWNETGREGDELIEWAPRRCPYGAPGDRLWVREAFSLLRKYGSATGQLPPEYEDWEGSLTGEATEKAYEWGNLLVSYKADNDPADRDCRWRPSIHMPRWASRLLLEVTDVRVERVQEISGEDCYAEGLRREWFSPGAAQHEFEALWDQINGKRGYGWESNPWVWVVTFKRIQP